MRGRRLSRRITKLKNILEEQPEPQFSLEDYIMLYTTIYNMCTQKPLHDYSQQLYDKYRESFEEYITSTMRARESGSAFGFSTTVASVKSTVLFIADADILEDETESCLWCWEGATTSTVTMEKIRAVGCWLCFSVLVLVEMLSQTVSRIEAVSEQLDMHMQLDVNTEIYPLHDGEKFMIVLASTLNLDGTLDSGYFTQIYIEVDKFGEELVKHPEKSSPSLFVTINGLFSKLEASIGHFYTVCQSDFSVDGSYSFPLMFEKFPEVNQEGSQWTNCEIRDAINLIYENLHKLDSYLNVITLEGLISQEKFEKSRAYSLDKSHFHFVHEFVTILMDSAILFFGGIALVVEDIRRLPCVHGSQCKE